MPIDRRQVLVLLACASGSALADGDPEPSRNSDSAAAGDTQMEKVLGIGGVFFRSKDPAALSHWYRDHLGVALMPTDYDTPPWHTEAGPTVFAAFPQDTKYFGADSKMWMVNFRVRDLDKMAAQLRIKARTERATRILGKPGTRQMMT